MKTSILILFLAVLTVPNVLSAQSKTIKGKVSFSDQALVNAEVLTSNSDVKVKTDLNGYYQVSANKGDILTFQYPGMNTVEIVVEDVTSILNVAMTQKLNELDEVVVKGSNRKSQAELEKEYTINKNLIRTAFGIIDKETAPGRVRFLHEDDINPIGLCILDLVRNEFPGVRVSGDCPYGGSIQIRGIQSLTSAPAIFDVDGMIFTDAPLWILPGNIHRIAILNNLATTTRYGSIASGGAIVINTKSGNPSSGKIIDRARLTNNYYKSDAIDFQAASKALPKYLVELEASENTEVAKEVYFENNKVYGSSPYYQIDAYRFFAERGDDKFATKIYSENREMLEENPVWAKGLAYQVDAFGKKQNSLDLYRQIFISRPEYAQSYRDLANSYRESGKFKRAAAIYARYHHLMDRGFLRKDTSGMAKVIKREFDNLLKVEENNLTAMGITDGENASEYDEKETRIFVEWNNGEAEFDLQFVNPENQYYTWSHTLEANSNRIHHEKLNGYSSEEFFIDKALPGLWQININYKGNKSLVPTYLKVTTFENYGTTYQTQKTKVFRLGLKNKNQKLMTVFQSATSID